MTGGERLRRIPEGGAARRTRKIGWKDGSACDWSRKQRSARRRSGSLSDWSRKQGGARRRIGSLSDWAEKTKARAKGASARASGGTEWARERCNDACDPSMPLSPCMVPTSLRYPVFPQLRHGQREEMKRRSTLSFPYAWRSCVSSVGRSHLKRELIKISNTIVYLYPLFISVGTSIW